MLNDVFMPARRFERFSVGLSVVCEATGSLLADQIVNLSLGGACVRTPTPLLPGTRTRFAITVPDAKLRPMICDIEARVAWATEHSMGLSFDKSHQCVDDYLRRLERASNSF